MLNDDNTASPTDSGDLSKVIVPSLQGVAPLL